MIIQKRFHPIVEKITSTLNCSARNRVFMLYCKLYMMFKKSTTLIDQACAANCCCFFKVWGPSRNTLKYTIFYWILSNQIGKPYLCRQLFFPSSLFVNQHCKCNFSSKSNSIFTTYWFSLTTDWLLKNKIVNFLHSFNYCFCITPKKMYISAWFISSITV